MKNIICFDIGGTFIKYGVVTEQGKILLKDKMPTPEHLCNVSIPNSLSEIIKDIKEEYEIEAVGISTAGQIDIEKGVVVAGANNIKDYNGTKLAEVVWKNTGLKVFVENDVNAAALGEMWMGAAKELNTFLCITLGTGIGGAIVINRKLYRGFGGNAGEVGHMSIDLKGESCGCGFRGCFERYSSTAALVRKYNEAAAKDLESGDKLSGEDIMEKVHEGDRTACSIYNNFLYNLVGGLVNLTHILDPGFIVIGGGISAQGDIFFSEVNRIFKEKVMDSYGKYTKIIKAGLDNDAGLLGACYTVKERLSHIDL